MKAIERFYTYLKLNSIKPTRFEKDFGLSNGYLGTQFRRKGNLGEDVLNIIIDNCLDLNPEWLLSGRGTMLKKIGNTKSVSTTEIIDVKDELIELQRELIDVLKKENADLKKITQ